MPLLIVRNDITRMKTDAIVNPTDIRLSGTGGVDAAIHQAAGEKLNEECRALHGCRAGEAVITKGYDLKAEYVIHTVGPQWIDGRHDEKKQLSSCYSRSLQLAFDYHCKSIAFPLISSGSCNVPGDIALQCASETITSFLMHHDMKVYLVIFDKEAFLISQKLYANIHAYIDDQYVDEHAVMRSNIVQRNELLSDECLENALEHMDESFSEMLLRKIDEAGLSDAECYKKANVDRRLFSKIRSDKYYKPSKSTVLAFAIALHLPRSEIDEMLEKAGYYLSHSSKSDIIVSYFIEHDNYDLFAINEALFAFDQKLIGG